jgi:hypothetical protein
LVKDARDEGGEGFSSEVIGNDLGFYSAKYRDTESDLEDTETLGAYVREGLEVSMKGVNNDRVKASQEIQDSRDRYRRLPPRRE